jgi:hypothetical protein
VAYLSVSVNDHRPAEYERIMRLPFAKTLERLYTIETMKATGAFSFPIYLTRVGDGTPADAEFLDWVRANYPSLNGLVKSRGNWLGMIEGHRSTIPNVSCRQWFELHILANGQAAFCCIDAEGKYGVGDAKLRHVIHDIYNHPTRRSLRQNIPSRRTIDICSTCQMLP